MALPGLLRRRLIIAIWLFLKWPATNGCLSSGVFFVQPTTFKTSARKTQAAQEIRCGRIREPQPPQTDPADPSIWPFKTRTDLALLYGLPSFAGPANAPITSFIDEANRWLLPRLAAGAEGVDATKGCPAICGRQRGQLRRVGAELWEAAGPRFSPLVRCGVNQSVEGYRPTVGGLINLICSPVMIGRPGAGPFSLTGASPMHGSGGRLASAHLLPGYRQCE